MRITCVLLALLILFSAGYARAETFALTADTNVHVSTLTTKSIDVALNSDTKDTFLIRVLEEKTWISLTTNRIFLEAGKSETFTIYFSPQRDVMLGTYKLTVVAESLLTGLQTEKVLFVTVEKGEVVEIEQVSVRGDMIPTGSVEAEVDVKNFRTVTVTDVPLEISVVSTHEIEHFSDIVERIDPDQTATIKHRFVLDRYSPPGNYYVLARLNYNNEILETKQDFAVVERAVPRSTEETQYFLLGYTKKMSVRNYGNVQLQDYAITRNLDSIEQSFFYGEKPSVRSKDSYTWHIASVKPGDEVTITYTINYVPIVIFAAIAAGCVWFIIFKVRTLRIKKYIVQRKIIKEGAEFTVGIEVKNSTGVKVNDVIVTDFVPSIFTVKDAHGMTARKLKSGAGTELRWEIKELVKNDERVLTYKLIPVFGIEGQIKLPPAKVSFKSGKSTKKNSSFAPRLGINQKVKE